MTARSLSLVAWLSTLSVSVALVLLWNSKTWSAEPAIEASNGSLVAWQYRFSSKADDLPDQIQRGCFNYLWNEVGSPAMLAKDKTSDTICSTAAVGFQLSSLPIGVERGWISRRDGQERALTVLRSLVP